MEKFIYVFCNEDKDKLLSLGYQLLKQNEKEEMYVFVNETQQKFSRLTMPYLTSDTLTF